MSYNYEAPRVTITQQQKPEQQHIISAEKLGITLPQNRVLKIKPSQNNIFNIQNRLAQFDSGDFWGWGWEGNYQYVEQVLDRDFDNGYMDQYCKNNHGSNASFLSANRQNSVFYCGENSSLQAEKYGRMQDTGEYNQIGVNYNDICQYRYNDPYYLQGREIINVQWDSWKLECRGEVKTPGRA
jgi:hypothetical protein